MKREVRQKKEQLYKQTKILRKLYWDYGLSYEKGVKLREQQAKLYDKWNFYSELLKAEEKIKSKNKKIN